MNTLTLPPVSAQCRQRLVAHYGPSLQPWIDAVPHVLAEAAARWSLGVRGYHDAGHASVLVAATGRRGEELLIKAWPDRDRYIREIRALQLWYGQTDRVVWATDDTTAVAALRIVGGIPGGAERPSDEERLVAAAIQRAHELGSRCEDAANVLPTLRSYIADEVRSRINRRLESTGHRHHVEPALMHAADVTDVLERRTILHADLYRENVLFTQNGQPLLLDPLPKIGDAAFDWAFWVIYYQLGHGTTNRLRRASRTSGVPISDIVPWCLLLGVDGLLFYEETDDARVTTMTNVLETMLRIATTKWLQ